MAPEGSWKGTGARWAAGAIRTRLARQLPFRFLDGSEIPRPDRQNALTNVNIWHYIHLGKSNCLADKLSVHVESQDDSQLAKEI